MPQTNEFPSNSVPQEGRRSNTCRVPHSGSANLGDRWGLQGRVDPESSVIEVSVTLPLFSIGRLADNDLCLRNPTVSGKHASLAITGRSLFVIDLQSTNGTFLNGHRVCGQAALHAGDILQFGTAVFELQQCSPATSGATMAFDVANDALALLEFSRLLHEPALVPYFQPIVNLSDGTLLGYEVLARSNLVRLETPAEMFRAAATRNAEAELSTLARWLGVHVGHRYGLPLFVNTHPREIGSDSLLRSLDDIRAAFPQVQLYLEIHEAAITSTETLAQLRRHLNELEIGLAYDDFGAGQARLLELVEVPPDVIKFDISLIQGLGRAHGERHRLVQSLVEILRQFGVTTLAEGVESVEEATICREIGFELAQGYFFGRPKPLSIAPEIPQPATDDEPTSEHIPCPPDCSSTDSTGTRSRADLEPCLVPQVD